MPGRYGRLAAFLIGLILAPAIAAHEAGAAEPRSFRLGLTPFPYAGTPLSFIEALRSVGDNADLILHHFDDGVPWAEALAGSGYAPEFEREMGARTALAPPGLVRFVAITPIAFERDRLAPQRQPAGDAGRAWRDRAFDDPDVIAAFGNYALHMIERFKPDYFAYAVEANMLADFAPERWPGFVKLAAAVYERLKAAHPALPVFITLQADWYYRAPQAQRAAIAEVLPYTDLIAFSSYAYSSGLDPVSAPSYFAPIRNLAPDKPVAVAETGWPAEDVTPPFPTAIRSDPAAQERYVAWLLRQAEDLDMLFVAWFMPRDLDAFWDSTLAALPNAATLRLFRDIGLIDGDGAARPALALWRQELARPYRPPAD